MFPNVRTTIKTILIIINYDTHYVFSHYIFVFIFYIFAYRAGLKSRLKYLPTYIYIKHYFQNINENTIIVFRDSFSKLYLENGHFHGPSIIIQQFLNLQSNKLLIYFKKPQAHVVLSKTRKITHWVNFLIYFQILINFSN